MTHALTDRDPDRDDPPPTTLGDAAPFPRALPRLLLGGGLVGLAASTVLTIEKHALDTDPTYQPSCSINPVLSCGSVMATPQASVFGFPNSIIGIVGFALLTFTGAALIRGTTRLPGWWWAGLQVGVLLGTGFVHWLIAQSLYRIGALCPYCMAVWAVTIPVAWYVTLRNSAHAGSRLPATIATVVGGLRQVHGVLLTGWFLVLAVLILLRFWDFWVSAVPS